jgi:hypothetical protein
VTKNAWNTLPTTWTVLAVPVAVLIGVTPDPVAAKRSSRPCDRDLTEVGGSADGGFGARAPCVCTGM